MDALSAWPPAPALGEWNSGGEQLNASQLAFFTQIVERAYEEAEEKHSENIRPQFDSSSLAATPAHEQRIGLQDVPSDVLQLLMGLLISGPTSESESPCPASSSCTTPPPLPRTWSAVGRTSNSMAVSAAATAPPRTSTFFNERHRFSHGAG